MEFIKNIFLFLQSEILKMSFGFRKHFGQVEIKSRS